ncbi:MAG: 4Fe-4S binding protein [Proteobacteria bacterium]|nr:4Fe-4S binding protein [Pseudomonadota bacterium]
MLDQTMTVLACSCAGTVPVDLAALARAFPKAQLVEGNDFAGADLGRAVAAARKGAQVVVGCACRQAVIEDAFAEAGVTAGVTFANLRELAGWSTQAAAAGPKMAALVARTASPEPDVPMTSLDSEGVTIILGHDETAIEVARQLADDLDITVLITGTAAIPVPAGVDFPVFRGRIRSATGHLGAFALTVDGFAEPARTSRGTFAFGPARNGAASNCDLIIDVTGGTALFPAPELRPGYLRADPASPAALARLIAEARTLVGTFDKPRYVTFRPELCAHSRSSITGCTRCLDVCPTGAISPNGDTVAFDAAVCAGCGGCGAVCPTGAASYALPAPDVLIGSLRAMLGAYSAAGGARAVLLLHDADHGEPLLHALAHHGPGLPATVIPVPVNEGTQIGPETLIAAFAYGAAGIRVLTREKPRHDETALHRTFDLTRAILAGLGFQDDALGIIATDDPDALADALATPPQGPVVRAAARFLPLGNKREVQRLALRELHAVAPKAEAVIALPEGAPMGRVVLDVAGCTLCHACVSACPADALTANPDRPELRFAEDLCVQCGLCAKTCPEKVITLEPRLDFAAIDAPPVLLKQEEPHLCDRCGKAFGTKATIARVRDKLAGKHWMFSGAHADRLAMIGLCEDCRVIVATEQSIDPYGTVERPRPRSADDYRKQGDKDA